VAGEVALDIFGSKTITPSPGPGLFLSSKLFTVVVVMRGVWGETHNLARVWITHEPLNTTTETKQVFC